MRLLILLLPILLFAKVSFTFNSVYQLIKGKYGLSALNFRGYMIESEVHIVGFSKDNLIFFVKKEPNEDRDYNIATATIINLQNNDLILKTSWDFKGKFINTIKQHQKDINQLAKEFNIIRKDIKTIKEFPATIDGITYKVDKQTEFIKYNKEKFLTKYKLYLKKYSTAFLLSKKNILSLEFDASNQLYNIYPLGVIKSPFSKNKAIFLAKVYRGYEGKPHILDIFVIGANL